MTAPADWLTGERPPLPQRADLAAGYEARTDMDLRVELMA